MAENSETLDTARKYRICLSLSAKMLEGITKDSTGEKQQVMIHDATGSQIAAREENLLLAFNTWRLASCGREKVLSISALGLCTVELFIKVNGNPEQIRQ